MRYSPIDNGLFVENRKNFMTQLPDNAVAIFHSADQAPRNGDQYHPFRQQSDMFYLSGIDQEKSILMVAPGHPNKKLREALFLIRTNEQIAIWEGHKYTKDEAAETSGIENIFWLDDYDLCLNEAMAWADKVFLNSNEQVKFLPDVEERNQREAKKLKDKFPLHTYHRAGPILTKLRMVKSDKEIELIEEACRITGKAFQKVLGSTTPAMMEFEVQANIEHEFTINRAGGHAYAPIIASGANACVLHYIENNSKLEKGQLMLMDFGAEYANYASDMSRTIPVDGKFSQRQRDCYQAVLRVFKELKKLYVPGNTIEMLNESANSMLEEEMIGLGLFTKEEVKAQDPQQPLFRRYFMHGVAHFMGLDVHDVGPKHEILKPGMVLTCEPGIYLPQEGFGIRIENDILITENNPVDLMQDIPIEVDEIEQAMQGR